MKYSRKFMREHYKSNCYVSNDGLHVERDYFDPKLLRKRVQELTTYLDAAEDRFYVLVSGKGKFYIDEMVLACYRGTMKDGKKYLVHHIDGDMRNSEVSNLEWREETPEYLQDRQKIIAASIDTSALRVAAAKKQAEMERYKSNNIEVNSKGQILQNGQVVSVRDYTSDDDMAWTYHNDHPHVRLDFYIARYKRDVEEWKYVNDIMEDFGMIEGNKADFANPVVLYKNHDYLDTTPGNMVWCDESDQRYIDFQKAAHEVVMEKDHQCNCYLPEESWKSVYGPNEPYRDWSDRPPVRHLCFG